MAQWTVISVIVPKSMQCLPFHNHACSYWRTRWPWDSSYWSLEILKSFDNIMYFRQLFRALFWNCSTFCKCKFKCKCFTNCSTTVHLYFWDSSSLYPHSCCQVTLLVTRCSSRCSFSVQLTYQAFCHPCPNFLCCFQCCCQQIQNELIF